LHLLNQGLELADAKLGIRFAISPLKGGALTLARLDEAMELIFACF
jgi:hypothetical protein